MPSPNPILRSRWAPALVLFGTLALPGSARADFLITYVFTDAEGTPMPQLRLTSTDMSAYSNQASCQCGHTWGARVFLDDTMGASIPASTPVRTYVGANCDAGQDGVGEAFPCVELFDGVASDYDEGGILLPFEQIWLSSRAQSFGMQDVESALPRSPCDPSQTGAGGIWICVESNGQPDCQADEFVVKGDASVNAYPEGTLANIQYDHVPPLATVTGFVASPGDGQVLITWDRAEVPDISGYRVLCADMDGNAPVTEVTDVPTGRERTNGKLYYTAENLCPGEVVYPPDPDAVPPGPSGDISDSPLASLDWGYVCSSHLASTGTSIRVEGLENDEEYQLVVVAYDQLGNPRVVSDVLTATPSGDGACSCRTGEPTPMGAWLGTGLLLLGLVQRRKSRRDLHG
jgi:MYXO-CTERM domain-containing protein